MRGPWGSGGSDWKIFEARVTWRVGTSLQQTGFKVRPAQYDLLTSPQEVADDILPWVDTNFRTLLGGNDQIVGIDVVNLVTLEGASISPSSMMGTLSNSGTEAPAYMCIPASLKGELRAKYGQGRMFLPVRAEALTNGDILTTGGQAAYEAVIDALFDAFSGHTLDGYNLVNAHGTIPPKAATATRPARPEVPPTWYDVTSIRLSQQLTFLRSRKAGVGS